MGGRNSKPSIITTLKVLNIDSERAELVDFDKINKLIKTKWMSCQFKVTTIFL